MATVTEYDTATLAGTTANQSVYDGPSFSPASTGELLVFAVVAGGTSDVATLTGDANGVTTFHLVDQAPFNTSNTAYLFVADALTTGTAAMTLSFDCTGDAASGAMMFGCGVVGMSKTGSTAVRQSTAIDNGTGGTTPEFVFAAACLTGNVTLYVLGEISSAGVLTPTGWTEGAESSFATPTVGGAYGYRESGFTGTTVTWPGNETGHGGVFVELDTTGSGTDGTATPGVIALTSTMPAATLSGGGTSTPAAIAAPVAMPAASAGASATTTPDAVVVTVTLPAATVTGGGTATPDPVAVTAALPAPTLSAGQTTAPATIATTVTLPAVTTGAGSTASPVVIPITIDLPAASASGGGGGDGTATPSVIACTASLPAATTSGGGTGTPATVQLALTFPAASAQGHASVSPSVIPVTLTTPSVTTGAGSTASPSVIALVTAVPNPGTSAGSTVNPATIALAITLAAAIASGAGADENPIAVTVRDYGHTVTATVEGTTTTARLLGSTETATEVGSTAITGRTYGSTTTAKEQT